MNVGLRILLAFAFTAAPFLIAWSTDLPSNFISGVHENLAQLWIITFCLIVMRQANLRRDAMLVGGAFFAALIADAIYMFHVTDPNREHLVAWFIADCLYQVFYWLLALFIISRNYHQIRSRTDLAIGISAGLGFFCLDDYVCDFTLFRQA